MTSLNEEVNILHITREGTVRYVLLQGGSYSSLEERDALIQRWYLDSESITYIVTARGHDHRIKQHNILGRFVSLDDLARTRSC